MGLSLNRLCQGVIVQSTTESITGPYLYSHNRHMNGEDCDYLLNVTPQKKEDVEYETFLNKFTKVPILGSIGGIVRIALSVFHTMGHACAYAITGDKGHKYHAIAGLCHLLRGLIETTPVIGQIFANTYGSGSRSWWMIKMYNPNKPDNFDKLIDKESVEVLEANLLYIHA